MNHKVESIKKPPEDQSTLKKHGRPRKGSSLDEGFKSQKKENCLQKRK